MVIGAIVFSDEAEAQIFVSFKVNYARHLCDAGVVECVDIARLDNHEDIYIAALSRANLFDFDIASLQGSTLSGAEKAGWLNASSSPFREEKRIATILALGHWPNRTVGSNLKLVRGGVPGVYGSDRYAPDGRFFWRVRPVPNTREMDKSALAEYQLAAGDAGSVNRFHPSEIRKISEPYRAAGREKNPEGWPRPFSFWPGLFHALCVAGFASGFFYIAHRQRTNLYATNGDVVVMAGTVFAAFLVFNSAGLFYSGHWLIPQVG